MPFKTQDEIAEFAKDWETLSREELMKKYNWSWDYLAHQGAKYGHGRPRDAQKKRLFDISIQKHNHTSDCASAPSYEDLISLMKQYSSASSNNLSSCTNIEIKTNDYVAIVFTSDWHLGHPGVDYQRFDEDINLICNTDNVFCYIGGDQIENMILPGFGFSGQLDPKLQYSLMVRVLEKLSDKILAVGTGNHNTWTETLSKIDVLDMLLKDNKIVYTKNGGLINITINGILYTVFRKHQYRLNSSFNLTHSVKQMLRLEDVDFDCGILEHGHVPAMESFFWKGRKRIACKTGSYKSLYDEYADSRGFTGVRACNPTIILNPRTYEILPFIDMREALSVLKGLNIGGKS